MSGRDQEGWDWMPLSASSTTIADLMKTEGWYFTSSNPSPGLFSLVSPGRFNYGQALHCSFNANESFTALKPIGSHNSAGGWVSAGLKIGPGNGDGFPFLGVYDAVNNQVLAAASLESNGVIKGWRGAPGSGTLLGASDPGSYFDVTFEDVEAFFVINSSTGEIEVRVNTGAVLSLTNVDTQPGAVAYFDSICFGYYNGGNSNVDWYIDDLRYYDTAGSINNTWLGTMRVQTCLAAGNGSTTDFTRSNTGLANWQNIANQNVDDSLYLYDDTAGDYNLSTIQPLVNTTAPVAWVGLTSFLRQDDATQITAKNRLVSGGVTLDGAAFLTAQTYSGDLDIYELDPATSLQFLGTAVNALQVGVLVDAIA